MWFRERRKELAQDFVDDVKKEVKKEVKEKTKTSKDWLKLALVLTPVAIGIVDHVIGTGTVNAQEVLKNPSSSNFTLYIDTVNIVNH